MKIGWLWADLWREWISSMWRVQFPHAGLLGAGIESRMASAHELGPDEDHHPFDDWADTIVIERVLFGHWQAHIHRWKQQGKMVFATFDDAYWLMPDYVTAKPTWSGEVIRQWFETLQTLIDGIFVPSVGLKEELIQWGHLLLPHKIHVIPNYPDLGFPAYEYALNAPKIRTDDRYVIGWGGSHHHSIEQLVPIFKQLIEIEPLVQIWIVGNSRAFNLLEDIPPENKRYFSPLPYGPYLSMIKQFDIFAIPLDGEYDFCRSWIKPLEAALMGVPWVATKNQIYQDCKGGVLVKTEKQWVDALLSPIAAGPEWAKQQDITDHIGEYLNVFGGDSNLRA